MTRHRGEFLRNVKSKDLAPARSLIRDLGLRPLFVGHRLDPRIRGRQLRQAVEPFCLTDRLSESERALLMGYLRQGLRLVAEED